MKHRLLYLLLLLLAAVGARAQAPATPAWTPGARWNYIAGLPFVGPGTLQLTYVGDTTISGRACQKLRRDVKWGSGSPLRQMPLFTSADANRVSVYVNGQFQTLYDFSIPPGGSWMTVDDVGGIAFCPTLVRVTVDSVGQKLIGGRLRRWFRAHYTPYTFPGGPVRTYSWGRVYEGLGPINSFMFLNGANYPVCGGTDPPYVGGLICYSINGQGEFTDSPTASCSTIVTAGRDAAAAAGFAVYPTVGSGEVTVTRPAAYSRATVRVFSAAGQLVDEQRLASATAETALHLGRLPRGLYLLHLQQPGQPLLTQRLVLQ
ncbi:T9SS type A sorting domain-containing protein [Hymenobacter edaphi]|uniref:Secretion system C-terminal sorting domain-containing protein n=1 Tax=Hymenobacter edaphi TaxID=2211146 RepID=A0A328BQP3_9BACT|nr:T9SS type A sorting domain-containing protein [Hymenobacter edaphi]RAK69397.1 hypothetical protein DLM85_00595 [Hymenobacter edaphi]